MNKDSSGPTVNTECFTRILTNISVYSFDANVGLGSWELRKIDEMPHGSQQLTHSNLKTTDHISSSLMPIHGNFITRQFSQIRF